MKNNVIVSLSAEIEQAVSYLPPGRMRNTARSKIKRLMKYANAGNRASQELEQMWGFTPDYTEADNGR